MATIVLVTLVPIFAPSTIGITLKNKLILIKSSINRIFRRIFFSNGNR